MSVARLAAVQCADPFSLLSWQSGESKGLLLRCYLPDAVQVEALELGTAKSLGHFSQCAELHGLFELELPRKRKTCLYQLKVTLGSGHSYVLTDPYQFREQAFYAVHYVNSLPENLYLQLGAQLVEFEQDKHLIKGTRFAVYAPNASSVSLIGDMNHWDGRRHPMQRTECGHWVLFMPEIAAGVRYKYEIKDSTGNLLPHKSDPLAFAAEQYPSHASLVYDHGKYQWQDQRWQQRKADSYHQPMSIYEVHLGSWKYNNKNEPLTYLQLIDQLIPYVLDMGYTHIELLPVMEHPYTGSWGYQPLGLFAATSRYGTPDQFKAFVDACHQAGIGVILDWVPAHFPEDGHGLARFDGSCLYEYEDPRKGWHPDWNSCIYDYGKDYVRQFLVASALYWFDYFHVDGLRVDAVASMLYLDYSRRAGEWIPNIDGGNHNYEAISLLKWLNTEVYSRFPNAMMVAEESTSFNGVSRPTDAGGLGFGYKWNMGWMNDSLRYISKDPAYRKYHHNDLTFAMVYAYNENFILPLSHDEVVHGKGSILGKMPGDEWQQAANLRAYYAFMYAHPGKKLNFMGNEFGQGTEWNHNQQLPWFLLEFDKHKGIQQLVRDLNLTYRKVTALHQLDHEAAGFRWLNYQDSEHSTLSFIRQDAEQQSLYVVANFTPVPRDGHALPVSEPGEYEVILNTDSAYYWGSNYPVILRLDDLQGTGASSPYQLRLDLPPLSTLYIRRKPE
ncbi:1,4-alpha-glucan branching protein GlgB [Rheinheimera sp.]|uniref:1,4-alpha-glucan branching protein GlgB n=1 Tax=Rheinheimera sp. TaxID=1869214 RepID=UPI00307FB718